MRLIDADLLLQKRFKDGMIEGNELLVPYNDVVNAIRQAPTVEGYCKESEVVEEIFEEFKKALNSLQEQVEEGRKNDSIKYQQFHDGRLTSIEAIKYFTAELKKKYTESENTE